MIQAFLYLQFTSAKNALAQRLKRLKQPKYLVGAVVGAAYFYFFFFRRAFSGSRGGPGAGGATLLPAELLTGLGSFGALALLIITVLVWIIPSGRAALRFTEAEVAFLFPAPITRRRLIHFKLLRSQLRILFSVLLLSLIFRRASMLGGNPLTHAIGWWVILSTLNLHLLGASFAREQLLTLGLNPARRRALVLGLLVLLGAACWWWIGRQPPPALKDLADLPAMTRYFGGVLGQPPLRWILAPFVLVIRPFFAANPSEFFLAMGPALLVIGAHYWWVIRADVSFEEASVDHARKFAERIAAVRAGDWRGGRQRPAKARPAPFPLAPTGPVPVAFLWKNLLALGSLFRPRPWLVAATLIVGFHVWAAATHLHPAIYMLTTIVPLSLGGWLLIAGPMVMRGDLRLLVSHFDLLKSYPLRGWQVVLGSLLPSLVLLAAIEWLLLLLGAPGLSAIPGHPHLAAGVLGTGALGIALVLPPLSGLLLSIPFAATLFFPAWAEIRGPRGGGIEVMGQRLIFFAGYLLVLLVALLPAVLCGGLAAFIVHWLAGLVAAIVTAALIASLVLGAEFAAVVWWLGDRFEHFDLSQDMPR